MTTPITIRINRDDKAKFLKICKDSGINASTAINLFIKKTVRDGELPFKVMSDPFYSDANQALLRKSIKEMEESGGTIHEIN